jgi:uncharacterized protein with gpF-like domain
LVGPSLSAAEAIANAKAILAECGGAFKAGDELDDDELQAEWEAVEALRAPLVDGAEPTIREVLDELAASVVAAVRRIADDPVSAETKADAEEVSAELVFDAEAFIEAVEEAMGAVVADAVREGIESGALRIGAEVDAIVTAIDVSGIDALREIVGKTQEMADTTRGLISDVIQKGIEERVSADVVADRLAEMFDELNPTRARTVAQTAVTGAWEAGQEAAYAEGGVDEKAWLTRRDGDVREAHAAADRQQVAVGDPYTVGGESLMYPGDPNGSAGNVIRCRCTSRPVLKSD